MSKTTRENRRLARLSPDRAATLSWLLPVLVVVSFAGYLWKGDVAIKQESDEAKRTHLKYVATDYMERHNHASNWWLNDAFASPEKLLPEFDRQRQQLTGLLKQYRSVCPLAGEIADAFPRFHVTIERGGSSMSLATSEKELLFDQQVPEVCFVAKDSAEPGPSSLYYRREWHALMVAGINWPQKVYPALVFHELGHWLSDKQGKPSAQASQDSDDWGGEEMVMYELEYRIMNAAARGTFFASLDRYLKNNGIDSWKNAVLWLKPEDFDAMDKLFGCKEAGHEVASVFAAQIMLSTGLRYIETKMPKPEQAKAKLELYRFVTSLSV